MHDIEEYQKIPFIFLKGKILHNRYAGVLESSSGQETRERRSRHTRLAVLWTLASFCEWFLQVLCELFVCFIHPSHQTQGCQAVFNHQPKALSLVIPWSSNEGKSTEPPSLFQWDIAVARAWEVVLYAQVML